MFSEPGATCLGFEFQTHLDQLGVLIHPVLLTLGSVSFSVIFAFQMLAGKPGNRAGTESSSEDPSASDQGRMPAKWRLLISGLKHSELSKASSAFCMILTKMLIAVRERQSQRKPWVWCGVVTGLKSCSSTRCCPLFYQETPALASF